MYRNSNLLFFIFFLYATVSFSQNNTQLTQTIRGTVYDIASRHPLPFVSVGVVGMPEVGTTSDEDGNFVLTKVPIGRHTLQATCLGYEATFVREILVTSSKELTVDISMKENVQELDEIVINPELNKHRPLNNMAVTGGRLLSVEEASRYAGGMDDPARLVSAFAGVSPAVSNNGISIHGNAPHLLQWRLEDVEIPNPNHFAEISTLGGGVLSSLSSHVLGNSDFYTGAFPAEYANAVSGVFDMKLRNGNNRKYENTFQVGILGMDFASEGPLSKKHNSSYIFNYRYSTTGLMSKVTGSDLGGVFDYQDLNFKLNFPSQKIGTFSVWGTSLIDGYKNDLEENTEKWEYNYDRGKTKTKQYMAAGGVGHRYFFNNNIFIKTTIAGTFFKHDAKEDIYDMSLGHTPFAHLDSRNTNLIVTTALNQKLSSKHTNKTGVTFTRMFYNMDLKIAPYETEPLETISEGKGNTNLISGYTNSSFNLTENITANVGVNGQILTLNNKWTIEPRAGIKWQTSSKSTFSLAYGLYSRMEKIDVYFVRDKETGDKLVNKNLDFTKSHHLMLGYDCKLSDNLHLKVEPYFQYLYDVAVIADSSYSVLNRTTFYVEDALVNTGRGINYGVDVTLEKFLTKGYYYMFTGSIFSSRYKGGDDKWYSTRFDRNFIVNALGGKEWMVGKNKQNIFSLNVKLTIQGGDRYSPVDTEATLLHPDKDVQYDETRAFSKQFEPMFISNFTASYKINKKKTSHEFAIKSINTTGAKEYYGHSYNFKTGNIDSDRGVTSLTNISYKIEF